MFEILAVFCGIALVVWVRHRATLDQMRLANPQMMNVAQPMDPRQESAIVDEIRALKQQLLEMQSTSHQFDLSFDEALGRLERRVEHLEGRQRQTSDSGVKPAVAGGDEPAVLRAGRP